MHQTICPSLTGTYCAHQLGYNLLVMHITELPPNCGNLVRHVLAALCSLPCAACHIVEHLRQGSCSAEHGRKHQPHSSYTVEHVLQVIVGNTVHVASVLQIMYCRAGQETPSM